MSYDSIQRAAVAALRSHDAAAAEAAVGQRLRQVADGGEARADARRSDSGANACAGRDGPGPRNGMANRGGRTS